MMVLIVEFVPIDMWTIFFGFNHLEEGYLFSIGISFNTTLESTVLSPIINKECYKTSSVNIKKSSAVKTST
jgi:hypothetical protein